MSKTYKVQFSKITKFNCLNFLEKSNDRCVFMYSVWCFLAPMLRTSHNTQTDLHGPCKARTLQHYSEIPLSSVSLVKLLEMWFYNITQISSQCFCGQEIITTSFYIFYIIFVLIINFWLDFFFSNDQFWSVCFLKWV